jgi:hypothetical protein
LRVRTVFLLGLMVVSLPGLIGTAWIAQTSWNRWRKARSAEASTRVISAVQRAHTAVVNEAGLLLSATLSAQPDREALAGGARATDGLLDAARRSLAVTGGNPRPVAEAQSVLAALRGQLVG